MLVADVLAQQLVKITDPDSSGFIGYEQSRDLCAMRFIAAFDAYARNAQDVSTDALASANFNTAVIALQSGWANSSTPDMAAIGFCEAFRTYWIGATFATRVPLLAPHPSTQPPGAVFISEQTSIVTQVETEGLRAALAQEFRVLGTGPAKAAALASVMHVATTQAVFCTITGLDASAPPKPCLNIATIG